MRKSLDYFLRRGPELEEELEGEVIPFPRLVETEDVAPSKLSTHDAILELIIFARENGGEDRPRLLRLIASLEKKALWQRERALARKNQGVICLRCEQRRSQDLLCPLCLEHAPHEIRHAFRLAVGIEGIRKANRKVRAWARRHS